MIEILSPYNPIAWQEKMHGTNWENAWLLGGKGGGKTKSAIEELLACAMEFPGTRYIIGRKTLPSLKDSTWREFITSVPEGLISDYNKNDRNVTLHNGSVFMGRPLDEMKKFESIEIAGFLLDEVDEVEKEIWDTLKTRVRQMVVVNGVRTKPRYRNIVVSNPPDEDHWLVDTFFSIKPKGHTVFQSTTFDNAQNLPDGYIDTLKATYSEDMQQRMIFGQLGKVHRGRPVFPQFARGNFIRTFEIDPKLPLYRSFDFGFNRPACVWIQIFGTQIRVVGEQLGKRIYLDDFVREKVLPYERDVLRVPEKIIFRAFCDPHGSDESDKGRTSTEILNDFGIFPIHRRTRIQEGIKAIKHFLDTQHEDEHKQMVPNFMIHPRCTNLIEGFRGGFHRLDGEDEPFKDNHYDHCLAEGTLVETDLGPLPIEQVKPGQLVKTRFGLMPVSDAHSNGTQECFRLKTSSGKTIVATGKHRFFINSIGWTTVDCLRYGDLLQAEGSWGSGFSQSSSMGLNFAGILTMLTRQLFATIVRTPFTLRRVFAVYIDTFGKSIMVQFPRAITSTTSTEISTTTTFLTLSALVPRPTGQSTQKSASDMETHKSIKIIWQRLGLSLRSGMQAKRVMPGTKSTQKIQLQKIEEKLETPALNVRKSIGQMKDYLNSVVRSTVISIARCALLTADTEKLVSIEPVGKRRVYDLTVPWAHEYIANGLVTHNCMDALRYTAVHLYKRLRFGDAQQVFDNQQAYVSKHGGYRREV